MDDRLSIDLHLDGKKIQVNVACINARAKEEIKALLSKDFINAKDILKAYIQKAQEYAELEDKIADLIMQIEVDAK